jgi:probable rRNA maturation factor
MRALDLLPRPTTLLPPLLEFHLLTPKAIQRIHLEFLQDETPTDVITFPYGEIFICPAIAETQRKEYQRKLYEEVLLYGIHALVHLKGYEDHSPKEFKQMQKIQETILEQILNRS